MNRRYVLDRGLLFLTMYLSYFRPRFENTAYLNRKDISMLSGPQTPSEFEQFKAAATADSRVAIARLETMRGARITLPSGWRGGLLQELCADALVVQVTRHAAWQLAQVMNQVAAMVDQYYRVDEIPVTPRVMDVVADLVRESGLVTLSAWHVHLFLHAGIAVTAGLPLLTQEDEFGRIAVKKGWGWVDLLVDEKEQIR